MLRSKEGNSIVLLPIWPTFFISADPSGSLGVIARLDSITCTFAAFASVLPWCLMLLAFGSILRDKLRLCCWLKSSKWPLLWSSLIYEKTWSFLSKALSVSASGSSG